MLVMYPVLPIRHCQLQVHSLQVNVSHTYLRFASELTSCLVLCSLYFFL